MLDPSFSFLSTQALTTPCTLGIFACFWSYHLVHFSMMFRGNTGASILLKKDGGFPKTRFPWCFWRKLPTNKSCPPMCSIEGFEIFEPWEVQQLWQGRRKVSGCIEIFCWLYHILATRNQLSHFWTKVGCRNAMSYTIFKNRVWWGLCFESFCSFLLNL